jgi:cell division protein FtsI/penicillin-binding protein 2
VSVFRKQASPPDEKDSKSSLGLRLNVFFFSTFVIFCVIIIRLAVVQFVEGPTLTEVETSRDTKSVPLASIRGAIRAAEGEEIAYSTSVQSLYVTLTKEYTAKALDKTTGVSSLTPEARANAYALATSLVEQFDKYGDPDGEKLTVNDVINSLDLYFKKYSGYMARKIKSGLTTQEIAISWSIKAISRGLRLLKKACGITTRIRLRWQTVGYIKPFKSSSTLNIYKNILNAMRRSMQIPD